MMLSELTQVPEAALPVAQLRDHLRLGSGFDGDDLQDGLLASFLRAALAEIEGRTGKALLRRGFRLVLEDWADSHAQPLPVAPVAAVSEVATLTREGVRTVLAPQGWALRADAVVPQLVPVAGVLPGVPVGGTAEITFDAGYGAAFGDLPADLAQAVMLLAAHYYEYRDATALGEGCMPFGVTSLIARYRRLRLGGRA